MIERQVAPPGRGWSTTCSTSRASPAARSSCAARRVRAGATSVAKGDRDGEPAARAAPARAATSTCRAGPAGRRRRDAAGAGGRQPAHQRRQVHRAGRRASRSGRARAATSVVLARARQRHRHRARACCRASSTCSCRSAQALDRAQGGLGLGLTIVRSLVELHGGTVEARSDGPGRGQRVHRAAAARGGADGAPASRRAQARRQAAAHARVLVVDDNADAAEMLAEAARRCCGHTTRVAHDGPTRAGARRRRSAARSRCSTSACR